MFATINDAPVATLNDAPPAALFEATASADRAIDSVFADGFSTLRADEAADSIVALERMGRRIQAAQVALLTKIDSSGMHSADGHFSARVMMRHHGRLAGAEASQRDRSARALRQLPNVAEAWQSGRIGTDQVRRIARIWSNPRIRHLVGECDSIFVEAAEALEYCDFDSFCHEWEEAVDADGAHKLAERRWERRSINLALDFNDTWDLKSRMTSLHGARLHDLLAQRAKAEYLSDSETAKALHGDNWRLHMPRSAAQIRYDIFTDLIFGTDRDSTGDRGHNDPVSGRAQPAHGITNVVIDQQSFEEQLGALCGVETNPSTPSEVAREIIAGKRFCHTLDGTPVSAAEVVAEALVARVRRVVINSAGVVVDVGRSQRLFTGSSRLAAMMQSTRCYWHGCWIPVTHCQIDHLTSWNEGGPTDQANAAPACRGHNHLKESGYQAARRPDGTIKIIRPDGRPTADHLTHWRAPPND